MAMIYPGLILSKIARLCRDHADQHGRGDGEDIIEIDQHQQNGMQCIHQAALRLNGDPQLYRIIIAPAGAEIFINKDRRPIDEAFAAPLQFNPKGSIA